MKKHFIYILLLAAITGCSVQRNSLSIGSDQSSMAHIEFYELLNGITYDTVQANSVQIYFFNLNKKGNITDSIQVDLSYIEKWSKIQPHTTYRIVYDCIGRDYERYASRDSLTYLNYRKIYGDNKKIKEWITYNKDGKVNSKTFYTYDNDNNLIHSEYYYGYSFLDSAKLEKTFDYYYNDDRLTKRVEKLSAGSDSTLNVTLTENYDNSGRLINYHSEFCSQTDMKTYIWGFVSTYGQDGRLTKQIITGNEREPSTKLFSYYPNGLPKEIKWFYNNNNKLRSLKRYYYENKEKTTANSGE